MRIESIEYEELDSGWKLCETSFASGVTLLVGLSGAGKTRILKAIHNLSTLATSDSIELSNAIRFQLVFTAQSGTTYRWEGETFVDAVSDESAAIGEIERELLIADGIEIYRNEGGKFQLRGQEIPPLSTAMSGLRLFTKDEAISNAVREFKNTVLINHGKPDVWSTLHLPKVDFERHKTEFSTIEKVRNSGLPLQLRVCLANYVAEDVFDEMNSRFSEAFPHVEQIGFQAFSLNRQITLFPVATEKSIAEPLSLSSLSSGMLNTFQLIAYCYLWPDGTLVLIDEFESSMGVNCLDDATDLVLETSRRMQFILTSHHPYVINNIRPDHWKIVTRDGGIVSTHNASEIGIGTSRHTAFTQLMNSKEYSEGILSK